MTTQMPTLRNDLRTALEAVSTASYDMQVAGIQAAPGLDLTRQDVQAIWHAMLNAALSETKSN